MNRQRQIYDSATLSPTDPGPLDKFGLALTMVGVWTPHKITSAQSRKIKRLNILCSEGLVGVHPCRNEATAVKWFVLVRNKDEAHQLSILLGRIVSAITGFRSVFREAPNYKAVSRALAA